MCYKWVKQIAFADYSSARGEIADVFKESTTVRSITGGYGMYVTRRYDAFAKAAIRLTISLKTKKKYILMCWNVQPKNTLNSTKLKAKQYIYGERISR